MFLFPDNFCAKNHLILNIIHFGRGLHETPNCPISVPGHHAYILLIIKQLNVVYQSAPRIQNCERSIPFSDFITQLPKSLYFPLNLPHPLYLLCDGGGGKCLINKHLHLRQQILLSGYRSLLRADRVYQPRHLIKNFARHLNFQICVRAWSHIRHLITPLRFYFSYKTTWNRA